MDVCISSVAIAELALPHRRWRILISVCEIRDNPSQGLGAIMRPTSTADDGHVAVPWRLSDLDYIFDKVSMKKCTSSSSCNMDVKGKEECGPNEILLAPWNDLSSARSIISEERQCGFNRHPLTRSPVSLLLLRSQSKPWTSAGSRGKKVRRSAIMYAAGWFTFQVLRV